MTDISFSFSGIEERTPYLFAVIALKIGSPDDPTIGYTNIRMEVPLSRRDRTLGELRTESLALARRSIQTEPLLAWMQAQEDEDRK